MLLSKDENCLLKINGSNGFIELVRCKQAGDQRLAGWINHEAGLGWLWASGRGGTRGFKGLDLGYYAP